MTTLVAQHDYLFVPLVSPTNKSIALLWQQSTCSFATYIVILFAPFGSWICAFTRKIVDYIRDVDRRS